MLVRVRACMNVSSCLSCVCLCVYICVSVAPSRMPRATMPRPIGVLFDAQGVEKKMATIETEAEAPDPVYEAAKEAARHRMKLPLHLRGSAVLKECIPAGGSAPGS